jgi:hypothetical protein
LGSNRTRLSDLVGNPTSSVRNAQMCITTLLTTPFNVCRSNQALIARKDDAQDGIEASTRWRPSATALGERPLIQLDSSGTVVARPTLPRGARPPDGACCCVVFMRGRGCSLLRGWRQQAVEAEVRGSAVMVGPVVGEGDQCEIPRCFAAAPDFSWAPFFTLMVLEISAINEPIEGGKKAGTSHCTPLGDSLNEL